ncbi:MerR family transcriptional regulator [Levilactobacillus hammesii]|uniref:MerR family transcriptional regulator n=1 Tax=Levilactobacillus hammesii TaxID=267633 RepID=UPI00070C374B|nr:MerR family transcriptional regulator [Levilactobacillus hammesii]
MSNNDSRVLGNPSGEKKHYTIGEFAMINRMSARMLRHYDKINLINPQTVLANGYRYYTSDQIPMISLIKTYQNCGFTLAEIASLLNANDATIRTMAKTKQQQLAQQDIKQDQANTLLLDLLGEGTAPLPDDNVVSVTRQPERHLFSESVPVREGEIDVAFDHLYGVLEHPGIHPTGLSLLLCDLEDENAAYRVAVPVSPGTTLPATLSRVTLPSGDYLSTFHYGDYDRIGAAYDCLLQAAQKQNHQLLMPFIERYLLDSTYTADRNAYITEISVKITP